MANDVFNLCFQLKTAREAATFGVTGAALGAVSTAAFAWKYSRSPHGNTTLLRGNENIYRSHTTRYFIMVPY